jgi:prolyl-tRNA synthetase
LSKEDVGITVSKEDDFSEWYTQVVLKAKLADYAPVKGLIVLRPDGNSIWESLKNTFDKKFAKNGIRNGFLPVLIPESLLGKEQKHFAGFNPEVFWVTHSGTNEVGDRLALRPTSETLAYTLYSKWIQSWRDLPLKINFWNTALRAEIKATKPFLRTSEFLWQEGHTVHITQEEAEEEVMRILEIYKNTVEEELAIPVTTGKKSEKEKFVGAVYTTTMESIMPDGKALQMGTSHFLGQNFSKPFEVKFADKDNVEHFAWQTSWGVSWRLIGAMIMVHGDDQGLVLPPKVAPTQVVIVPIYRNDEGRDKVLPKVKEIQEILESQDIRIQVDDRQGLSPGYKFNDWEMKGVPIRIEIGPKDIEKQSIVVAKRYNREKINLEINEIEKIVSILEEIQKNMLEKAREQAKEKSRRKDRYYKTRY